MSPKKPARSINIAIALNYDNKTTAPTVSAKGKGVTADAILQCAEEHDIPIKEDPELVQLLSNVELGETIPENLYLAVAEVLAFAYHLKDQTFEDH